jgi:hypothetical protein
MRPETNDVGCLDHASFGPYKIWSADLYKCPICGNKIIIGFGAAAIREHFEEGFKTLIDSYSKENKLYHNKE